MTRLGKKVCYVGTILPKEVRSPWVFMFYLEKTIKVIGDTAFFLAKRNNCGR